MSVMWDIAEWQIRPVCMYVASKQNSEVNKNWNYNKHENAIQKL